MADRTVGELRLLLWSSGTLLDAYPVVVQGRCAGVIMEKPLTIRELIEILTLLPGDTEVYYHHDEEGEVPLTFVGPAELQLYGPVDIVTKRRVKAGTKAILLLG